MKIFVKILLAAFFAATVYGDETTAPLSVGGKTDISNDDQSVRNLLKTNLARLVSGDQGSLELVSIKSVTKQVVAGLKYDVTGTFKLGDQTKDCVVTIWSRSWLDDENERVKLRANCGGQSINTQNDTEVW